MNMDLQRLLLNRVLAFVVILLVSVTAFAGSADFRKRAHEDLRDNQFNEDDVRAEIRFGRSISARILAKLPLHNDKRLNAYVQLVGQTLVQHSSRPELKFHFAVVKSPGINAFSTPGGYIFITTGALNIINDEAELAAVLAHEIAHVTERHIVRELRIRSTDASAAAGLARIVGGASDTLRTAFKQSVDKAVSILFEKGYKMEDELEADRVGTLLLANTGYNPTSLISLMIRIQSEMRGKKHKEHVTHPPTSKRLQALMGFIRANDLANTRFPKLRKRYRQYVRK